MLHLRQFIKLKNFKSSSTMSTFVGLCQMRSTNDKQFNRDQVCELVKRAENKSSFLFFPECVDYVGTTVDETIALAEPLEGQTVQFYKELW